MHMSLRRIVITAALTAAACASPAAADPSRDLLAAQRATSGLAAVSSRWDVQELGGGPSVGGVRREPTNAGPRQLGRKFTAGLLSLALPGAGQLYNGDRDRALAFAGAEAAVWTAYFVFHSQATGYSEDSREYAQIFAGVRDPVHTENYWRAVGRYMESEEFNTALMMEARAEGRDPATAPGLLDPAEGWFWRSGDHRENYQNLRADANRAYDRRDFMILFAIVNRAVSAYDAVRGAGTGDHLLEVAGLGFDLESRPSGGHGGTACVISRSF
ncbi:MAG: hypothetical protein Q7W56_03980 [Candidatus Latescibacteria bacterium]|nr:hypothetical protein [Candidatus Latescibacterota bacterium]